MDRSAKVTKKSVVVGTRTVDVIQCLSDGGHGFVYKAKDKDGNFYALKKIQCSCPERLEEISREAKLLKELPPCPFIPKYYGSSVAIQSGKQHLLLLLELCEGGTLGDLINKQLLSIDNIVKISSHVLRALLHLHEAGTPIVHRDVKLENILLDVPTQTWKLCDFGSAVRESEFLKNNKSELMDDIERHTTPAYRSPELIDVCSDDPLSSKVDVWMFGCVLFAMCFSRLPFERESNLAILNAKLNITASESARRPLAIQQLIYWCLSPNAEDRPTAQECLQSLRHIKSDRGLRLPQATRARYEMDRRNNARDPLQKETGSIPRILSQPDTLSSAGALQDSHHSLARNPALMSSKHTPHWGSLKKMSNSVSAAALLAHSPQNPGSPLHSARLESRCYTFEATRLPPLASSIEERLSTDECQAGQYWTSAEWRQTSTVDPNMKSADMKTTKISTSEEPPSDWMDFPSDVLSFVPSVCGRDCQV